MINFRKRMRIPGWDYRWQGWYFITIRVVEGAPILSTITSTGAAPTLVGSIIAGVIRELPTRFSRLVVHRSMIMPDHVHFVFELLPLGDAPDLGASISQIVQAFKSITTIAVNRFLGTPGAILWQRSFFDRVLRNEREFEDACIYVENNPMRWLERHRDDERDPESTMN